MGDDDHTHRRVGSQNSFCSACILARLGHYLDMDGYERGLVRESGTAVLALSQESVVRRVMENFDQYVREQTGYFVPSMNERFS